MYIWYVVKYDMRYKIYTLLIDDVYTCMIVKYIIR